MLACRLLGFQYQSKAFELYPRSLFYEWINLNALNADPEYHEELIRNDIFTDIEYNMKKLFASQARSVTCFFSLERRDLLNDALEDIDSF